ncbi:P-loop containing nucleoside triphosphate hydrolase protein [Mycena latifolia]|nr:P-loop containing nucleoside triphosphate hydrolase protein [Mycena latifolia]
MQQYFSQDLDQQHIYVLHGLGGAGKTQIALKFIQQSASRFSSTFFIDASTPETIETGLIYIAVTRKISATAEAAKQWLTSKHKEWLLFFDNADNPKIDLNSFFPQCNHGSIIITSRNPGLCVYAGAASDVSNLDEDEAVQLLLRSAAQDIKDLKNQLDAAAIVKELIYLPLAIVQAGAFIAKSRNLEGYLALYAANKTRLLSDKPTQSHDNYAWTVYTTWQISFEKLSPLAARFLQLCSCLHHEGIYEEIFVKASKYNFKPSGPAEKDLRNAWEFLSQFLGTKNSWDFLKFQDITTEIMAYSLINFDPTTKVFSMHPLVHDWCHDTATKQEEGHSCMIGILGMYLTSIPRHDMQLVSMRLLSHVDALVAGETQIVPDFRAECAVVYTFAGKHSKAFNLEVAVLETRRGCLGEDHPDTLRAMTELAATYRNLGKNEEAKKLQIDALEKHRQQLGKFHLETLMVMAELAITYQHLDQFEEAKKLELTVLNERTKQLGDDHPETLTAMDHLAVTYQQLGQHEEAKNFMVRVLERRRRVLGDDHPHTLVAMGNLAVTYGHLGQLEEGKKLQVTVLETRRKLLGDDHPLTLRAMGNLAGTYHKLGQFEEAKEL